MPLSHASTSPSGSTQLIHSAAVLALRLAAALAVATVNAYYLRIRGEHDSLASYLYTLTAYNNLIVGIVYGIYIVLYVTSVHILLRKPGFTLSRPRMVMFGITTFMFAMGIIALVLEMALGFQQYQYSTRGNVWSPYHTNVVFAVGITIIRIMVCLHFYAIYLTRLKAVQYILSDIICAWRAVVLWNRDKRVIAILLLFILGTIAAGGCELGLGLIPCFKYNEPYYYSFKGFANIRVSGPIIMVAPTLGTNLVSTGLIAWKAWQCRVLVRKHLHEGSGSVNVGRVFALLIESGFIYCCLLVLYLISVFGMIPPPTFAIMNHVLFFSSALYPTIIIVLVAMQKSPIDHCSTRSAGMQVAAGPALGPTSTRDMPRHSYPIRREYVSDHDTHIPSMVLVRTSDEENGL
ncbi:hypothetical protein H4582DRAFT_2101524 [Lactarius indigo]|nr:hypothetical protein H4582DRAFT_2101524 [Lactarius indigo]